MKQHSAADFMRTAWVVMFVAFLLVFFFDAWKTYTFAFVLGTLFGGTAILGHPWLVEDLRRRYK